VILLATPGQLMLQALVNKGNLMLGNRTVFGLANML
jgi:hypothetical protein